MSKRTVLSRPRTRIYDANYSLGENMYRPALDRLDRKYSGRPLTPPRSVPSIPREIESRHERAFADEDLTSARRRAEQHIAGETLFDSRGARIDARGMDFFDVDINDEVVSRIKSLRANKKISQIDDVDMESTVNNISSRRLLDRSEKLLDSVGISDSSSRKAVDADISIKRRAIRFAQEDDISARDLTKWTAVKDSEEETGAAIRAKQTRARLNDLEEEMQALEEKQAAREKRVARLRALVAESAAEDIEPVQTSHRSLRLKAREEIEY